MNILVKAFLFTLYASLTASGVMLIVILLKKY